MPVGNGVSNHTRMRPVAQSIPRVRLQDQEQRKTPRISLAARALLKSLKRRNNQINPHTVKKFADVFKLHEPPPWVNKSNLPKIAQDSNITNLLGWAGTLTGITSAFAEGVTWLGYPYLSELAQRPEYRRITETISNEMTRKWVKYQSKSTDESEGTISKIKELTDYVDSFHIRDVFRKVANYDGYFGRGHIYIDLGNTDDSDELKVNIGDADPRKAGSYAVSKEKVARNSLRGLKAIEPIWCYPTQYESTNPLKDDWYNPTQWFAMSTQIHSSRLLTFVGREVPDILKPVYNFGGLSMSQMAKPYVDNWLRTRQSVADIISSFSVFVLFTELMSSLQVGGEELFERLEVFNDLRDNAGVMALDKSSEEFKNVSAPLGTLDTLQAQTLEHICSVSGIPLVKYTGISPHGLNASSEGEIRVFYDWINSYQELLFSDHLNRILRIAQLSLWGEVDEDITFAYEPLWAMDEKQQVEVREIEMRTAAQAIDTGVLRPEEHRKAIAADPDSPWSGINVEDVPDLKQEEEQGLMPKGAGGMGGLGGGEEEGTTDEYEARAYMDAQRATRRRDILRQLLEASNQELAATAERLGLEITPEEIDQEIADSFDDEPLESAPAKFEPVSKRRSRVLGTLLNSPDERISKLANAITALVRGGNVDPNSRFAKLAKFLVPKELSNDNQELSRYAKLGRLLVQRDQATDTDDANSRISKLARILNSTADDVDYDGRFRKFAYIIGNLALAEDEADFKEAEHPRDASGQFTSGGGSSGSKKKYSNFSEGKLDFDVLQKVGGQLGSNEGGTYTDDVNDKDYYVKKGKSKAHVKNELLAAKLYSLAGAPTLKYKEVLGDDYIATEWQKKQKDNAKDFTAEEREKAQEDFATHAWLANWDAAGLDYDNLAMIDGKATNVDLGGALEYRAQGEPKGDKFGATVGEWDTLRDPDINEQNAVIFGGPEKHGGMSKEQLKKSAEKVVKIPDKLIFDAVEEMGLPKSLAAKLVDRKLDIAEKAGLEDLYDQVNAEFEAKHKRGAGGKFIKTGGGEEFEQPDKEAGHEPKEEPAATPTKKEDMAPKKKVSMSQQFKDYHALADKAKALGITEVKTYLHWKPGSHYFASYADGEKKLGVLQEKIEKKIGKQKSSAEVLFEPSKKAFEQHDLNNAKANIQSWYKFNPNGNEIGAYNYVMENATDAEKQSLVSTYGSITSAVKFLESKKEIKKEVPETKAEPPTEAELEKAKKGTPYPNNAVSSTGQYLIEKFNEKYSNKALTAPAELEEKVDAFKKMKEAVTKADAAIIEAKQKEEVASLAKEMNDPEAAKHLKVLHDVGINKNYIDAAKSKIKKHGLDISPVQGAYIQAYVGAHYEPVNAGLRQKKISKEHYKYAFELDKALSKMPQYKGTVYRGVSLTNEQFAHYKNSIGMVIPEPGFQSAGVQSKLWGNHTMIIESKTAADIRSFNNHEGGGEVVFKNNTAFEVTKVEGNKIYMTEFVHE